MRRLALSALALLVAATGCRQLLGLETPTTGSAGGDASDGPGLDAGLCFGAAPYTICLAAAPTSNVTISSPTIDTTVCMNGMLIDVDGTSTCVIAGSSVSVGPIAVTAKGQNPLALLATGDLTIGGQLDASSRLGVPGPGGRLDCQVIGGSGAANSNGGGGGAGGTFGTQGGNGGFGAGGAAAGGFAAPTAMSAGLLGGCPGGAGGDGSGMTGGMGGGAGGAVYLLAGTMKINGQVLAGGGGGFGGVKARGGGGGAGSGGLILLWSPNTIENGGGLFANGGGGGGGASGTSDGLLGEDGNASVMPAIGGDGSGKGGSGCAAAGVGGQTGSTGGGGAGGGGGGCGIIHTLGAALGGSGIVSPPAS